MPRQLTTTVLFLSALLACAGCGQRPPAAPNGDKPAPRRLPPTTAPSTAQVSRVYWSGDGKWLVTTSGDGTVTVWDPTKDWVPPAGKPPIDLGRFTFEGPAQFPWAAVAGDLLVDNLAGRLTVREVSTGRTLRTLDQSEHLDANDRFYLADGGQRVIAYTARRQEFNIWDVATGKLVGTALPKTDHVADQMVGVSADGAEAYVVLTGVRDPAGEFKPHDIEGVHAVDLKTGKVEMRAKHPIRYTGDTTVVQAADGRAFLGSEVWDLRTGKKVGTGPRNEPLVVDPAGRLLADMNYVDERTGYRVKVWDVAKEKELGQLPRLAVNFGYHGFAFSPDGKYLAVGGGRDWDPDRLPLGRRPPEPPLYLGESAPYRPKFQYVDDRVLLLYDAATLKRVRTVAFPIWPLDSNEVPNPEIP